MALKFPDFLQGALNFCALSPNLVWYQHNSCDCLLGGAGLRDHRGLGRLGGCKLCRIDFNSATSLRRYSSSEVVLMAAIYEDGMATSIILSASWAISSRFPVSGVEARTIRTFGGKR